MTTAQVPQEPPPATEEVLGHRIRFPIFVDDVWRSCCNCHWWWAVEAPKEAGK